MDLNGKITAQAMGMEARRRKIARTKCPFYTEDAMRNWVCGWDLMDDYLSGVDLRKPAPAEGDH